MSESTLVGVDPRLPIAIPFEASEPRRRRLLIWLARSLPLLALAIGYFVLWATDNTGQGMYFAHPGQHPLRLLMLSTNDVIVISAAYRLPAMTFYVVGIIRSMASLPVSIYSGKLAGQGLGRLKSWGVKILNDKRHNRAVDKAAKLVELFAQVKTSATNRLKRPGQCLNRKAEAVLRRNETKKNEATEKKASPLFLAAIAASCFVPFYGLPVVDIAAARGVGWKTLTAIMLPAKVCKLYLLYKVGHMYNFNLFGRLEQAI